MTIWLVMLAAGALTFAIRLSFIAAEGRLRPSSAFRAMLPFVPIAALTALIVPEVLVLGGQLAVQGNPRLPAALIATAVAWRWRNATATLVAGFTALALLS